MKKIIVIASILALIILGISSCKTVNDCPAYGKAQANSVEKRA
ncbi:MAG: hypothetical protein PHE56_02990 [Bacteroidales bacterium]|jgi:hypothetical protein|nr:hypothetical protein [Bacteroidales bacterium]